MKRASAFLAMLLGAAACSEPERAPGEAEHLRQWTDYRRYSIVPPRDLIVAADVDATASGRELLEQTASALRELAVHDARGTAPWREDLWNTIDQRAFVGSASAERVATPADDPDLAWLEADATVERAERFASAIAAAIDRAAKDKSGRGVVKAMRAANAAAATPLERGRLVVLVASRDDEDAVVAREQSLRSGGEDLVYVVLPTCTRGWMPRLEAWARANAASIQCAGTVGFDSYATYRTDCLTATVGERRGRCHVRAYGPRGMSCTSLRGWQSPTEARSTPLRADLVDTTVCDVASLHDAADLASCTDGLRAYEGRGSGWCLPAPNRWCPTPLPRVVGAAAPPWITIERVCEFE